MKRVISNCWRPQRTRRGSVVVYFLIITSVLVTSMITSMALSGGLQTQSASLLYYRDNAIYAADSGLQEALWRIRYGAWPGAGTSGTFNGSAGNYTYSVTMVKTGGAAVYPITISSVGSYQSGGASVSQSTITSSVSATSRGVPSISLGGTLNSGGGFHANGDIQIYGPLGVNGNVSKNGNFNIDGNIWATGTIASGINYSAGFQGYPNRSDIPAPPDVSTIATTLRNTPGAVQFNVADTWDFRLAGGTNKIIYYVGNISNLKDPTIYGDGTVVILGNFDIKKASTFSGHSLNIVVAGAGSFAVDPGASFNLPGSLYVQGNITSQSQMTVQGVIVADGSMSTQGQGSDIQNLGQPWFDSRTNGGYLTGTTNILLMGTTSPGY